MSVKRQVVRVVEEGVGEAIADLQRINAGLDKTSQKAQRTSAEVDKAQGKGKGLTGFLERAKGAGFFKRSGVEFGPLEIGRGGIGMNQGFLRSSMGTAGMVVVAASHGVAGALGSINNMRDAIDEAGSFGEGVKRGLLRNQRDIAEKVYGFTGAERLTREIFRLFGTKGEVFDEAVNQLKDDLFTTAEEKRQRAEKEARAQALKRAIEQQQEEAERNAREAIKAKIRAMQDAIDQDTNRAVARIWRTRQLGIRFARGQDQESAERRIDELNERLRRQEDEQRKKDAEKNMPNVGG